MVEHEKVYSNDMLAIIRTPINPEFMAWLDHANRTGWIVVKDTSENIALFNDRFKKIDIPDSVTVYYNEPEYYDLIEDGLRTRDKIKKEKERQERLENPRIWKEVEKIETKDALIEYLLDCWDLYNSTSIYEYSSDLEIEEKEFALTSKELNKKIKELL